MSTKAKWEAASQQIRDLTERLRKASAAAATMRKELDEAKAEALRNWERLGEANHRTLEAMAERDAALERVAALEHDLEAMRDERDAEIMGNNPW